MDWRLPIDQQKPVAPFATERHAETDRQLHRVRRVPPRRRRPRLDRARDPAARSARACCTIAAGLTEGEGVSADSRCRAQRQLVCLDLAGVNQSVKPLVGDRREAVLHVLAGVSSADRLPSSSTSILRGLLPCEPSTRNVRRETVLKSTKARLTAVAPHLRQPSGPAHQDIRPDDR